MTKTQHINLNLLEPHDGLDPAALNANARAVDAAVTADRAAIAAKADTTALAALAARVDGAYGEIGRVEAVKGNCRVAFGSYVGTGTYGEASAIRLELDFMPLAVLVGKNATSGSTLNTAWPAVMLRGCTGAHSDAGDVKMTVVWEDRAVKWYFGGGNNNAALHQCNNSSYTYFYVVLGMGGPEAAGGGT